MTEKTAQTDWERIEHLYRAGLLSVREIAASCGVSHTAIQKKAKTLGWERDLKAKIAAKANALVAKSEVSKEVATETLATERGIVEANAQVIASIRIGHRTDIGRYRKLASKLLDELEGVTDNRELFEELGEILHNPDDTRLSDAYHKVIGLPSRTKTLKELGETLKNLIALERQAYDVGVESPADNHDNLTDEELERKIAKLAGL